MNSRILAERNALALQTIQAEVERLGGRVEMPTRGFRDPATKHALTLEAIAEGLAGIGAPPAGAEVEPVEAVIAVVAEDAPEPEPAKAAPKKRGKE